MLLFLRFPICLDLLMPRPVSMATAKQMEARYLHRSRLPRWSRPDLGVRGTLPRDRGTPVPQTLQFASSKRRKRESDKAGQEARQVDRSIAFLRQQHLETLQQLHLETERLKRENRELNFKLIMCRCGHTCSRTGSRHRTSSQPPTEIDTPTDELQILFLQEEAGKLRQALAAERSKNARLLQLLQHRLELHKSPSREKGEGEGNEMECVTEPTLQDYEAKIRHLQQEKEQKAHELTQIKADLKDILYSHKWTPDAYLLARAYVSHDEEKAEERKQKGTCMVHVYQRVQERVHLPALMPHLPADEAEKQRRRQAVQGKVARRLPPLHLPPCDRP